MSFFINFNSIKVRLIHFGFGDSLDFSRFQFHKGSINTNTLLHPIRSGVRFQFHKGSINTDFLQPL